MTTAQPVPVLVGEDDPDDRLLLREAFRDSGLANALHFADDGQQLLDYLQRQPPYDDPVRHPLPGLILLDLNMPRMDGREALLALKADPRLRRIPVVVFSTSDALEDQNRCRNADAWISKPSSYSALLDVVRHLGDHWLSTAPHAPEPQPS
jgi:CheY-like chemotaxis protein